MRSPNSESSKWRDQPDVPIRESASPETTARTHIPIRTCMGCLSKKDKYSMIRVAYRRDQLLKIDPEQRAPGRGFYLCPDVHCIREFFKRQRFKRLRLNPDAAQREALKEELLKMVHQDKVLSLVGLARKAGQVVVGQHAVENAVKTRQARLVILSRDAALNTRKRFIDLARNHNAMLRIYGEKADLGHWMGRESAAVLAILQDGFARAIAAEIARAEGAANRSAPPGE